MKQDDSANDAENFENLVGCLALVGLVLTTSLLVAFYFIQFYR